MAFLEKSNWVIVAVSVVTLVAYLAMVGPQALSTPVSKVSFVEPMIYTIVGFIGANILGHILAAASNPKEADKTDQRDKEIDRFGERVGNSFIIVGSCIALVLAMAKQDYFWIANAIYIGGLTAALLASVTKIAAYHGPFQKW
jgi:Mn2+/Fe2+ NRAMP family transporter